MVGSLVQENYSKVSCVGLGDRTQERVLRINNIIKYVDHNRSYKRKISTHNLRDGITLKI